MARTKESIPTEAEMLDLTIAIEQLTEEVHVLRQALDEFRQEFSWMLNNREEFRCRPTGDQPVMHITSMPKDVSAPDFGERINRYSARDLPDADAEALPNSETGEQSGQGTLW